MNADQYVEYYLETGKIRQNAFDLYWDGLTDTDWTDAAFENSTMMRHNATSPVVAKKVLSICQCHIWIMMVSLLEILIHMNV